MPLNAPRPRCAATGYALDFGQSCDWQLFEEQNWSAEGPPRTPIGLAQAGHYHPSGQLGMVHRRRRRRLLARRLSALEEALPF
jgi:hypothetical protein